MGAAVLNVKAAERKSRSSIPLLVFWVLIFDVLRITFSSGGDQQTTGPNIQVEATLYLLHLSVARSHT